MKKIPAKLKGYLISECNLPKVLTSVVIVSGSLGQMKDFDMKIMVHNRELLTAHNLL